MLNQEYMELLLSVIKVPESVARDITVGLLFQGHEGNYTVNTEVYSLVLKLVYLLKHIIPDHHQKLIIADFILKHAFLLLREKNNNDDSDDKEQGEIIRYLLNLKNKNKQHSIIKKEDEDEAEDDNDIASIFTSIHLIKQIEDDVLPVLEILDVRFAEILSKVITEHSLFNNIDRSDYDQEVIFHTLFLPSLTILNETSLEVMESKLDSFLLVKHVIDMYQLCLLIGFIKSDFGSAYLKEIKPNLKPYITTKALTFIANYFRVIASINISIIDSSDYYISTHGPHLRYKTQLRFYLSMLDVLTGSDIKNQTIYETAYNNPKYIEYDMPSSGNNKHNFANMTKRVQEFISNNFIKGLLFRMYVHILSYIFTKSRIPLQFTDNLAISAQYLSYVDYIIPNYSSDILPELVSVKKETNNNNNTKIQPTVETPMIDIFSDKIENTIDQSNTKKYFAFNNTSESDCNLLFHFITILIGSDNTSYASILPNGDQTKGNTLGVLLSRVIALLTKWINLNIILTVYLMKECESFSVNILPLKLIVNVQQKFINDITQLRSEMIGPNSFVLTPGGFIHYLSELRSLIQQMETEIKALLNVLYNNNTITEKKLPNIYEYNINEKTGQLVLSKTLPEYTWQKIAANFEIYEEDIKFNILERIHEYNLFQSHKNNFMLMHVNAFDSKRTLDNTVIKQKSDFRKKIQDMLYKNNLSYKERILVILLFDYEYIDTYVIKVTPGESESVTNVNITSIMCTESRGSLLSLTTVFSSQSYASSISNFITTIKNEYNIAQRKNKKLNIDYSTKNDQIKIINKLSNYTNYSTPNARIFNRFIYSHWVSECILNGIDVDLFTSEGFTLIFGNWIQTYIFQTYKYILIARYKLSMK